MIENRTLKVLRATNRKYEDLYKLYNPHDLIILQNPRFEKIYDKLDKSLKIHGMIHPLLITDEKTYWGKFWPLDDYGNRKPGIGVVTGNQRAVFARVEGYDRVECIFVNKDETMIYNKEFHMKSRDYPDENSPKNTGIGKVDHGW